MQIKRTKKNERKRKRERERPMPITIWKFNGKNLI